MSNNSHFNYGKWERKGASFTWEIIYLNGYPRRGHSKPEGQAEPFGGNHYKLLKHAFDRLLINHQYLQRIQKITVWRCLTDHDKDNKEVFTLYPAEFRLSKELLSKRDEETHALRELLRSYYEDSSRIYNVTDPNDMSQLFSCKSTTDSYKPASTAPQKVKTFDELNQESKTLYFKNEAAFNKYIDALPKYLTQTQRTKIISEIYLNEANAKWVNKR